MKSPGKIIKYGLPVLLAVIVLWNLWQLAARMLLKQDLPELLGYSNLVVLSGSMEPAVSAGDVIIIHRQKSYETGDVITYRDGGTLTTHRIVAENDEGFQTRGDANNIADDSLVPPDRIMGRVVFVIPAAGNILLFLRTPAGLGGILALGFLAFFAAEHKKD